MRKTLVSAAVFLVAIAGAATGQEAKAPAQVLTTAAELKWGPPPPVFGKEASFATVQVHGMGPFALTYVNPADDPSKRAPGK